MNILLINHYAGNRDYGMEFRPYYMAREWLKQGHSVTIIASSFSHLRQKNPDVKNNFQEEVVDGVKYVWLKGNAYGGSVARIRNISSFVWKLLIYARKISKKYTPDLVIASSTYPLDNIPAHKIARIAKAKHCYEAHDIWPLSPLVIGGYSKYHPFILVMQWAENYACKKSDKVISLLWNSEMHYQECGLKPGKYACVPNGYSQTDWADEIVNKDLPLEYQIVFDSLSEKIVVGFAGGIVPSGALGTLVRAANELKDNHKIHFVIVGNGPDKQELEGFVKNNNLSNVVFLPAVPKVFIPALNKRFSIAYMGGVHSILHQYGTSYNKMTDYMLSGKPIIQAIDEPGCIAQKVGCGLQVEAENPQKVADAIVRLAEISEEERSAMGEKGREYAKANLEWGTLARRFLEFMSS